MTSREDMLRALGVIGAADTGGPKVDPFTEKAYKDMEDKEWRKGTWYRTSFTGGKFPGGKDELRCARQAMYRLMSAPEVSPIEPRGVAVMRQGMAAEDQIVYRWGKMGITIGGSVPLREKNMSESRQLKLVDPDFWLASSLDSTLDLRPEWEAVLPVDVKSKADAVITQMEKGEKSYDPDHYAQIQIYVRECQRVHVDMGWDALGLDPARGGTIYYVSRDNPRHACEFYVEYDEQYVNAGLQRLLEWREFFKAGVLPERDKNWRWTEPPCKWCDHKKLCKADIKDDVENVADSHAVRLGESVKKGYNAEEAKRAVLKRWEVA